MNHLEFPILGAKWAIGSIALFHTAVASLGIGFAFFVFVAQMVGYQKKERRYDLIAKKVQLIHVCIYNIGTINAIGLIFLLSGLFPQFWAQIFVQFFWPIIVEEFLFFLLATTLTFHYFFWDRLWGHKKMHIFLGSILTPLFFLQFYIINGLGGFMLTPGAGEAEISLRTGILGWDRLGFYNPSFLMLTAHRTLANVAYGGFGVAAICGALLYLNKKPGMVRFWESGGRLAFYTAFIAFLSLPVVGYFYAHVLKNFAGEAYMNLMFGKGDIAAGGVDWWWLKHIFVAGMLGVTLTYFHKTSPRGGRFAIPRVMVYSVSLMYVMFYFAMGMIMTWAFFFYTLAAAAGGAMLTVHLLNYHKGSPKAVFLLVGILSFMTVMLGGYSREASRPRFVNRISHYDNVFVPQDRQPYLMVDRKPGEQAVAAARPKPPGPQDLIRKHCVRCHTLKKVRAYSREDWGRIIKQMQAFGMRISDEQADQMAAYLKAGKPY